MAYNRLTAKAANDVLGPGTLKAMSQNTSEIQRLISAEHNAGDGEHNAANIARVVRRITKAPAVSPLSSDITVVTNPIPGRYVLTLASGRFDTNMQASVSVIPEAIKPHIASVKIVSATSIEVFTKRMISTLSSVGNVWAAQDTAFDIAIYSTPLAADPYDLPGPVQEFGRNLAPAYGLAGGGSNTTPSHWSLLVGQQAELYARMTAEHTSAGAHNTRQFASFAGHVYYDGSKYDSLSPGLLSCTFGRPSIGVCTITHAATSTPKSQLVCADYERTNGGSFVPYIVNATDSSSTVTTVYCFKWSAADGWWEPDDCDFWISIHA